MMRMPKAVFFDLDDTIITGDSVSDDCWRTVCAQFASRLGEVGSERLYAEICKARRWYWGDLERHRQGRANLQRARGEVVLRALEACGCGDASMAGEVAQSYAAILAQKVAPFPGAVETLEWFRGRGVPLALITNGTSEEQRRKINKFKLDLFFDLIVVEGEFGAGKPEAAVFRHALARFGCEPSEAWMVGDKLEFDIAGAGALGIFTVWNDYRGAGMPAAPVAMPDLIVRAIRELRP